MKKLFIFSMFVLLMMSSCTCFISVAQIPPQYIYANSGCQGVLPNYIPIVHVTDNCAGVVVTQNPLAGYKLSGQEQSVTVLITAKDIFNNKATASFTVTLIDTIPPVIFYDTAIVSQNYLMIEKMYDTADRLLARQELWFDANFDYEAYGIPDTLRPLQEYFNKILVTWTTPAKAFTNKGGRYHTFINESDTLLIRPKSDNWISLLK